jgi:hypothetical protein
LCICASFLIGLLSFHLLVVFPFGWFVYLPFVILSCVSVLPS